MQPQRAMSMVTAHGHQHDSAKPGEVTNIHISVADNGFTVDVEHKMAPPKPNQAVDWEAGRARTVFNSLDQLVEYVRSELSSGAPKKKDSKAK